MSSALRSIRARLAPLFQSRLAPADASGTLLFFIHLPKTGGTSLTTVLRRVYGRHYLNVGKRGRQIESGDVKWNQVHCCSGHLQADWTDDLLDGTGAPAFAGREVRKICVVREPISRVISYYRYVTSTPKHRLHTVTRGMTADRFFSFLDDEGCVECWNQQARMLRGQEGTLFLAAPLDRMDGLSQILAVSCGWRKTPKVPRINTSIASDFNPISESVREMIRERSALDLALYAAISERFERGDFPAQKISASIASTNA